MFLEQEIASVIHFILRAVRNTKPYYHSVPEQFVMPAVYFPSPEITTGGETFLTYRMEFTWYITFHHKTSEDAYALAHAALSAIMGRRCLIPLIAEDGRNAGGYLRVNSLSIKQVDTGVYQLALSFVSRRPYDAEAASSASGFIMDLHSKSTDTADANSYVKLIDEMGKLLHDEAGHIMLG